MNEFLEQILPVITSYGIRIAMALLVYTIGTIIIKLIHKALRKGKLLSKTEGSVKSFTLSFVKIGLYVILVVSVIAILGVPMASVITVLASAGVAIGLALQGALSNLAGGIMIMIFKPFKQDDYIEAAGVAGSVSEVTLFYTVLITPDRKRITVPNGSLMNANVINYSSEEIRRVDLTFSCAKTEDVARVQEILLGVAEKTESILQDPTPFVKISGSTNEAMQFAVRVWCKNEDYWNIYFDITQRATEALKENDVQIPCVSVVTRSEK